MSAGPTGQSTIRATLPAGMSRKSGNTSLAWRIENLMRDTDGSLRSVRGPCPWEQGAPGAAPTYGAFHGAVHLQAPRDLLIIRTGDKLRAHAGWNRDYITLVSGLSDDANPKYPDSFSVLNGQVIWTNGIDRARVILPDGTTFVLGFSHAPSAPTVESPATTDGDDTSRINYYSNSGGYSFWGRIGTVGDEISQVEGKLLRGAWFYYVQFKDMLGNLSPLSPSSNAASVFPQSAIQHTDPYDYSSDNMQEEVDDLTRQFLVRLTGDTPTHAVEWLLHRTPDTLNVGFQPRLVDVIPGSAETLYPDSTPDAELGPDALDVVPVPTFAISTVHQGRHIIANVGGSSGMVMASEVGLAGTFQRKMRCIPDSNGAEITGVASYNGALLAFTETCIYKLAITQDGIGVEPLVEGVGCTAPQSIRARRTGQLIWLSRVGFYALSGEQLEQLSDPISEYIGDHLNVDRLRLAVAAVEPETDTYYCAVTPTGYSTQKLMLSYDGAGWRVFDLGISVGAMCTLKDERGYLLFGGYDGTSNNLFVFDHEHMDYAPPARTYTYRSGWLRADDLGMTPFRVRTLYLQMLRSWQGTMTVKFYKDNKPTQVGSSQSVRMVDTAFYENDKPAATAVIGTTQVHRAAEFWRKCAVPSELDTCFSFAFELSCDDPAFMHLLAFGYDAAAVGSGQTLARLEEPL